MPDGVWKYISEIFRKTPIKKVYLSKVPGYNPVTLLKDDSITVFQSEFVVFLEQLST